MDHEEIIDTTVEEAPVVEYDGPGGSALEFAKQRINFITQVKKLALEHTTENDWVLQSSRQGPVPYLQATGAEKIGRLFGVGVDSIKSNRYSTLVGNEEHYVWEFTGRFYLQSNRADSIECLGSRSSGDPFFQNQKNFDERDVKQAAYSNFIVNGFTRLLGLRGLTVEDLEKAGLQPDKMRGVDYKGGKSTSGSGTAPPASSSASKETAKKLLDLIKQVVGDRQDFQKMFLEEITQFTGKDGKVVPGITTFKNASERRLEVTLGRLRAAIEDGQYPTDGTYYSGKKEEAADQDELGF